MTREELIKEFDKLQEKFGSRTCNSVYGGGEDRNLGLCLVFMNQTKKKKPEWAFFGGPAGTRCMRRLP